MLLWPGPDPPPPPTPTPGPSPTATLAPTEVPEELTVTGYASPLKVEFLKDPEVASILLNRYGLTVEVESRSTQTILCQVPIEDSDFLWVGDQTQIETYEGCRNRSDGWRNVFISPVVIYSWADTTDALIDQGVVTVAPDGSYRADMVKLLEIIESGAKWPEIGLPSITSPVIVETTDPNRSTSGGHFAALVANTMNCMDVVGMEDVDRVLTDIHAYFERLGFMPTSSLELFKLYISMGKGSYALVALYESQIVEFILSNPQVVQAVQNDLRMIYPEPTVWITHPIITLTDGGVRLRDALMDPDLQRLAWEKNGFRPLEPGVRPDFEIVPLPLPETLTAAIDVPSNAVMDQVLAAAGPDYVPDPNAPPRRECPPSSPDSPGTVPASPVAVRQTAITLTMRTRTGKSKHTPPSGTPALCVRPDRSMTWAPHVSRAEIRRFADDPA